MYDFIQKVVKINTYKIHGYKATNLTHTNVFRNLCIGQMVKKTINIPKSNKLAILLTSKISNSSKNNISEEKILGEIQY